MSPDGSVHLSCRVSDAIGGDVSCEAHVGRNRPAERSDDNGRITGKFSRRVANFSLDADTGNGHEGRCGIT